VCVSECFDPVRLYSVRLRANAICANAKAATVIPRSPITATVIAVFPGRTRSRRLLWRADPWTGSVSELRCVEWVETRDWADTHPA